MSPPLSYFNRMPFGANKIIQGLWIGAELSVMEQLSISSFLLNGHDYHYERFAPQTPTGVADGSRGIREFIVGTGGRSHYAVTSLKPNSQVSNGSTYGVLKLTLSASSYFWQFVPVAGQTFTDAGTASCH